MSAYDSIEERVKRRPYEMTVEERDEQHQLWRLAEANPEAPQNDHRLSIRARGVIANAGLWSRHDVRIALQHESWLRCAARNCGPVTIAELRRWLETTNDVARSWDEQFGVAV